MIKHLLISIICGLIGGITFSIVHHQFYSQSMAVINMDQIISSHLHKYGSQKLNDKERKHLTQSFSSTLNQVIKDVSDENNLIFLTDPAVISTLPDYTDYIKEKIEQQFGI